MGVRLVQKRGAGLTRETEVAIEILVACVRSNDCLVKTADAAKVAATATDFAAHVVLKLVNAGLVKPNVVEAVS